MSIVNCSSQEANENDFINDTEFTLRLKNPLQSVVGFSLLETVIPFSWYPVPAFSIPFKFDSMGCSLDLDVPAGFYSATELAAKITSITDTEAPLLTHLSCTYDSEKDRFDFANAHDEELLIYFDDAGVDALRILGRTSHKLTLDASETESEIADWDNEELYLSPRLTDPDVIYMTTDLMIDSQNTKHSSGSRIMIPVQVNPGGIIHYSVDADEESIPLTFYQNVQTIAINFFDGATNEKIGGTRGQPVYLRFRFHFRH